MSTREPHPVDIEYPFDPTARDAFPPLKGYDFLRSIEDRELAALAYDGMKNTEGRLEGEARERVKERRILAPEDYQEELDRRYR
jgi:hypothetical protein